MFNTSFMNCLSDNDSISAVMIINSLADSRKSSIFASEIKRFYGFAALRADEFLVSPEYIIT